MNRFHTTLTFLRTLPMLVLFAALVLCLNLGWLILPLLGYFWHGWPGVAAGLAIWWGVHSIAHACGYFEV